MRNIKSLCLCSIIFVVLSSNSYAVETKLSRTITNMKSAINKGNIVLGVVAEATDAFCIMNKVASAIADEMGKDITLKPIPSKRLPKFVEQGVVHGDFSRTAVYQTMVPSAIKIENPIVKLPFYAYGLNPENKKVTDWASLKKYKLAQTRGYSFIKKFLSEHNVHILSGERAAFGFILAGRADLMVTDVVTAGLIINKYSPEFDAIKKVGTVLDYLEMNTYISPYYPELVDDYNRALGVVSRSKGYASLLTKEGC